MRPFIPHPITSEKTTRYSPRPFELSSRSWVQFCSTNSLRTCAVKCHFLHPEVPEVLAPAKVGLKVMFTESIPGSLLASPIGPPRLQARIGSVQNWRNRILSASGTRICIFNLREFILIAGSTQDRILKDPTLDPTWIILFSFRGIQHLNGLRKMTPQHAIESGLNFIWA